ncbi:MAG: hypothetical protein H7336_05580 [Bacteriovorax sp.]|nr:hypothetical protein [Bacteriovorax sp.]
MKHLNRLGLVAITLLGLAGIFCANKAQAMSAMNLACPEKYIATVTSVEDVASSTFPKVEVDFQIIQTLKGEKISSKKMLVVKGGPVEFKSGEIYTFEANDQWLCSASVFSKI